MLIHGAQHAKSMHKFAISGNKRKQMFTTHQIVQWHRLPNLNIEINVFPSNTGLKVRSPADPLKDFKGVILCFLF